MELARHQFWTSYGSKQSLSLDAEMFSAMKYNQRTERYDIGFVTEESNNYET